MLAVAVATVDRPPRDRPEGDAGRRATLRTHRVEQLARTAHAVAVGFAVASAAGRRPAPTAIRAAPPVAAAAAAAPIRPPGLTSIPTRFAPLRNLSEPFAVVELLLPCGEQKILRAICARQ